MGVVFLEGEVSCGRASPSLVEICIENSYTMVCA